MATAHPGVRITSTELRSDDGATLPPPPAHDGSADPAWTTGPKAVGSTVGGAYRLEAVVGRGAAATVFAATHELSGERVAVKVLEPKGRSAHEARSRFVREARAVAKVEHPNIVHLIELGCDADGTLYQVLELLDGSDLAGALERGPLSVTTTLAVGHQVLAALEEVHRRGFVHRDVKPENVFVCSGEGATPHVKLLDFGVARDTDACLPSITGEDALLGDPSYMSPEQITMERPTTARSDVWSVGALLFTCLAGHPPFGAPNLARRMLEVVREPAPRIESFHAEVPRRLGDAIERALAKHPADRFPSAQAMATALPQRG